MECKQHGAALGGTHKYINTHKYIKISSVRATVQYLTPTKILKFKMFDLLSKNACELKLVKIYYHKRLLAAAWCTNEKYYN